MNTLKENLTQYKEILVGRHRELVQSWLTGSRIQVLLKGAWMDTNYPMWLDNHDYRVRPNYINNKYYKVTLLYSKAPRVMSYCGTMDCFIDRDTIAWELGEFFGEPEFIC